jgi:hypothetical protein
MYHDIFVKMLNEERRKDLLREAEACRLSRKIEAAKAGWQGSILSQLGKILINIGQKVEARGTKKVAGAV